MIKYSSLSLLLFILMLSISAISLAQETTTKLPEIEKIYLHTDRDTYTIGEDLWYKVYSTYAYNNILFEHSKLLYVELISPENQVVIRNITKLDSGLGHGDFKLTDSLGVDREGIYQLRAYTNWMKNFGNDFVFTKAISIANLETKRPEIETKVQLDHSTTVDHAEIPVSSLKLAFFPEGGSLVENVPSEVAFKITDDLGAPVNVSGEIKNSKGDIVGHFQTTHDGMGKFRLLPKPSEAYTAIIKNDGQEKRFDIPQAKALGYTLSVRASKDMQIITLKTNAATLAARSDEPITIIGSLRGVTYFEGTQSLGRTTLSFAIPEADFPAGIAQFTLFDSNKIPHSERLVFIDKSNQIKVTLNTNKKTYSKKEKVDVSVTAKSIEGTPLKASMSMAVVDGTLIPLEQLKAGTSISSHFLMESDLKGKVHHPGQYFDVDDPNRFRKLDLLLLVNGWRDFLWKTLPSPKGNKHYRIEKGFQVSGYVVSPNGSGPLQNAEINMALLNKGESIFLVNKTDAKGRFQFDDLGFFGEATMMINSKNEKGKNKGKFVFSQTLSDTLDIFKEDLPEKRGKRPNDFKSNVFKKYVLNNVPIENRLDEVLIEGSKKAKERQKTHKGDQSFAVDTSKRNFSSIFQLIQYYIPGVIASNNSIRFSRGAPLLFLDEVEVDASILATVIPDDVESVDYIKSARAAFFGSKGANGVILVYTKEGSINKRIKKKPHSVVNALKGFYDARMFYAPSYETNKQTIEVDARNTLYWNPYVHPDESGHVKCSFYNSEIGGAGVNITLEGLTESGIPIVSRTSYYVEN